MLYSDASGVEHRDSGPHNSSNKSSGRMNRRSPYSKPPDAFMCGERPKKHLLLNASCRLLCMEVDPLCFPLYQYPVDQMHPFVQTSFPGECPLYQDDNAPIHTAKIVQEWFAEHEGEVGHLDWPLQSPDLNIIEHLWGYLESKLLARFPPPSTISALETALHEEWLHIPLQVVHDLYACSYYFVTHLYLIGVLPVEINNIIAREPEEQASDYEHIKEVLLKRFKLSAEKFRQLLIKTQKNSEATWYDFYHELKTFLDGGLNGLKIETFEQLKDLMLVDQIKRCAPNEFKEHFLDEWATITSPKKLVEKIEEFEDAKKNDRREVETGRL
ncbi:retrovirus-related Pol polyprotein from transposon 17.6 [Trichonephila clavipes]|nr:retrovirus-related Pol polyprotein from transposon 17.6 [Trichonephila clavipes]